VKTHTLRKICTVLFSLAFVLMASSGNVFAATAIKTAAPTVSNNTNTLKISPVRSDVTINPGGSTQVQVIVTNITGTAISLQPIENDFVAGPDENGEPALILSPTQYAPTHSLKRFMAALPTSVIVPAHNSTTIPLTINVPKTAQAGGYFGAVRFAPSGSTTSGKSVNLNESVASIILMTVPGPTIESVGLTNFDVKQNGSVATNFRNPNNLSLFLRFEDKGNEQEAPFGQIYVKKGTKVVDSYNFNQGPVKQEILPDSARRWTIPLKGFGKFGKYTVGATFTYGESNQKTLNVTKTIWIIPTILIYVSLGVLAAVIILILVIVWFLKSYKKRILKRSRW
jgi:hypothetical protein